jgi:GNAT superfamily N-acetyltransferase
MSPVVGKSDSIQNRSAIEPPFSLSIRELCKDDLSEADRVFRLAFGTFIGLPDPLAFFAGREIIRPRWLLNPVGALAAESNGELIGSDFATAWGSVGFFGPLTVRPDFWDRGVAKRLLERSMPLFDAWNVRHTGLFTFPHSTKHVGLYQRFGFYPRFLTAVMIQQIALMSSPPDIARFSALAVDQQKEALRACRDLTEQLFGGLNLETEIRAIQQHNFGDTVLLWEGSRLRGFAVCQFGKGSEGGPNCCYIKFAAAHPGANVGANFDCLLDHCRALAITESLPAIEAGVNLACDDAYKKMLAHGFRTVVQGIAMHRPNDSGYHRPSSYVISDWR